jgi:hypothetical protein
MNTDKNLTAHGELQFILIPFCGTKETMSDQLLGIVPKLVASIYLGKAKVTSSSATLILSSQSKDEALHGSTMSSP